MGIANFLQGIGNGTTLLTTPNMTRCQNAFYYIYMGGNKTYVQISDNTTVYGSLLAIDMALDITYHFYDVNFACYYGAYEIEDEGLTFITFASDPTVLLYNIVLNIGLIYDAVKNIIAFFVFPDYCKSDTTYELGYDIGQVFYLLFNPNSIY